MKGNLQIDIKVEFVKDQDGGYAAYADVFDAYGVGDTKPEALRSLKKTISLYVDEYGRQSRSALFNKIESYGFKKSIVIPKAKKDKTYRKINLDIPLGNYGESKERSFA